MNLIVANKVFLLILLMVLSTCQSNQKEHKTEDVDTRVKPADTIFSSNPVVQDTIKYSTNTNLIKQLPVSSENTLLPYGYKKLFEIAKQPIIEYKIIDTIIPYCNNEYYIYPQNSKLVKNVKAPVYPEEYMPDGLNHSKIAAIAKFQINNDNNAILYYYEINDSEFVDLIVVDSLDKSIDHLNIFFSKNVEEKNNIGFKKKFFYIDSKANIYLYYMDYIYQGEAEIYSFYKKEQYNIINGNINIIEKKRPNVKNSPL